MVDSPVIRRRSFAVVCEWPNARASRPARARRKDVVRRRFAIAGEGLRRIQARWFKATAMMGRMIRRAIATASMAVASKELKKDREEERKEFTGRRGAGTKEVRESRAPKVKAVAALCSATALQTWRKFSIPFCV